MNKYASALFWCSAGFTVGALVTLCVPLFAAAIIGAVILMAILIAARPRRTRREKRLPSSAKRKKSVSKAR